MKLAFRMLRCFLKALLRMLYGFEAYNDRVLALRGPVLLLPNHVSWWDWLLVGVCLDSDWRFVTSSTSAETSWLHRLIMINGRTFPVDMTSPYAVKHMAEYLARGGRLVLFPEGRISTSGSLMKIYEGTGFLLGKTRAKVIVCFLRGAEQLPYSRNPGKKQLFPKVTAHFSEAKMAPHHHEIGSGAARAFLTHWIEREMLEHQFTTEMSFGPETVQQALSLAARVQPGKVIVQDSSLTALTYRRLLTGAAALAKRWRLSDVKPRVGVLLPNVNAMPVVLASLWAAGRTPAILNFTMGPATLASCARVAGLQEVITSREFVTRANLDLGPLVATGIRLIYLEEVREGISRVQKLTSLLGQLLRPGISDNNQKGSDAAVVLFTSGSEGEPKAVELTHRNLLANVRQMLCMVDVAETDRFFNALPLFHSFGLTIGLILPLVRRVFTFLYVSPLHYRVVPAAFYDMDCTVLFGTNTFLAGYGRKGHPYDFRTCRYVFAGAEKLQEQTSRLWMHKFGLRILEGYGVTECSPCISVNVPMRPREGSVGQLLPGIEWRIEEVAGVACEPEAAGKLFVKGPNVMRGYVNPEADKAFKALGGWYDTGDVVHVDPQGYLFVLGRLKRFAKISGEMVSLAAVEEALSKSLQHHGTKLELAVVSVPDQQRGEKLVLVCNSPQVTVDEARHALRLNGMSNLAVPREVKILPALPRLGTGKINYPALLKLMSS